MSTLDEKCRALITIWKEIGYAELSGMRDAADMLEEVLNGSCPSYVASIQDWEPRRPEVGDFKSAIAMLKDESER